MVGNNDLYNKLPRLVQSAFNLVKFFYSNSPSIQSRIMSVFMKHGIEVFYLYSNPLAKDENPVSSAVIREGVMLPVTALNIAQNTKYRMSHPETMDFTHLIANGLRFSCKVGFVKYSNQTSINPVVISRTSNIICDSFGVMGLDLSQNSQRLNNVNYINLPIIKNYRLLTWEFFSSKLTSSYLATSFFTAAFKAVVVDQVGEVIKANRKSDIFLKGANLIKDRIYWVVENGLGIPKNLLENKYENIYQQMDAIYEESENKLNAKVANFIIGSYELSARAIPDLFIIGPIMLSSAASAVGFFYELEPISYTGIKDLSTSIIFNGEVNNYPLVKTLSIAAGSIIGIINKDFIFSTYAKVVPEMAVIGATMLLDQVYDLAEKSSPEVKIGAIVGLGLYSHFKEEISHNLSDLVNTTYGMLGLNEHSNDVTI